jgi:uncharacterized membrane protein
MLIAAHADPTFTRMMQAMLILAALLGIWLALFTHNALTTLNRIAQSRVMRILSWGFPQTRVNLENKIVFWFYRIDGAVVAIGCIYSLITGRYAH